MTKIYDYDKYGHKIKSVAWQRCDKQANTKAKLVKVAYQSYNKVWSPSK